MSFPIAPVQKMLQWDAPLLNQCGQGVEGKGAASSSRAGPSEPLTPLPCAVVAGMGFPWEMGGFCLQPPALFVQDGDFQIHQLFLTLPLPHAQPMRDPTVYKYTDKEHKITISHIIPKVMLLRPVTVARVMLSWSWHHPVPILGCSTPSPAVALGCRWEWGLEMMEKQVCSDCPAWSGSGFGMRTMKWVWGSPCLMERQNKMISCRYSGFLRALSARFAVINSHHSRAGAA